MKAWLKGGLIGLAVFGIGFFGLLILSPMINWISFFPLTWIFVALGSIIQMLFYIPSLISGYLTGGGSPLITGLFMIPIAFIFCFLVGALIGLIIDIIIKIIKKKK